MARIENNYNILALVLEGDEPEVEAGINIGDICDEFIKILDAADYLLIPVLITQVADPDDYTAPMVCTIVNSEDSIITFNGVEDTSVTVFNSRPTGD